MLAKYSAGKDAGSRSRDCLYSCCPNSNRETGLPIVVELSLAKITFGTIITSISNSTGIVFLDEGPENSGFLRRSN